jgi:hypothetical protein
MKLFRRVFLSSPFSFLQNTIPNIRLAIPDVIVIYAKGDIEAGMFLAKM